MRKKLIPLIIAYITLFSGAAVLGFPVIATIWNNYADGIYASAKVKTVTHLDKTILDKQITNAQNYNKTIISSPILDPWLNKYIAGDNAKYKQYESELNFTGKDDAMGILEIPKIKTYLPIYHGTSDDTLAKGVGHLFGTSLPVGGKATNSVLTGHTGFSRKTIFDQIPKLTPGDQVKIIVGNEILYYKVTGHKIVLPTETDDLGIKNSDDMVTLITCYPYAQNTHRWLVFAHRTDSPKDANNETPDIVAPSLWEVAKASPLWVKALGALSISLFLLLFIIIFKQLRSWRHKK